MNTKGIRKIGKVLAKNSPTILTGMSVAGLLTTAVLAVKATPKALRLLDEERYRRIDEDIPDGDIIDFKDAFLITWKCYVPPAVIGLLTIGCIISSNSINLRRNAALASVYSLSEAALKEYQAKVVETIGNNKERQIRDDIAKDRITKNPVSDNEVLVTGMGESLCYDALSGRYFKNDIEQIRRVMNDLSRDLLTGMDAFVTLNEVYYGLGLKATKLGETIGWHVDDGLIEPTFSSQLTENGTPCLVMDFSVEPRYGYRD